MANTAGVDAGFREESVDMHAPEGAAVMGTSPVRSARHVLQGDPPFTYLEFRGCCDFIEALVLHPTIVVVGPLAPLDRRFVLDVQQQLGHESMTLVDPAARGGEWVESSDISTRVQRLLRSVFRGRAPRLSAKQLRFYPVATRSVDDELPELADRLFAFVSRREVGWAVDFEALAAELLREYAMGLTNLSQAFFSQYLFRTFWYAAIADALGGTVVADGLRKCPLLALHGSLGRGAVCALAKSVYDAADAAFRLAFERSQPPGGRPYVPLATAFAFAHARRRDGMIAGLRHERSHLAAYRKRMLDYQRETTAASTSLARRSRLRNELMGESLALLTDAVSTLSLKPTGARGFLMSLLGNSLASIGGTSVAASAGGDGGEREISASIKGELLRGTVKAYRETRGATRVSELHDMVKQCAEVDAVFERLAAAIPIEDADSAASLKYEALLSAVATWS